MKVYNIYSNERNDGQFSNTLITSIIVLANNESEAMQTVLNKYSNSFTCSDKDLLIEDIYTINEKPFILSCKYNSF